MSDNAEARGGKLRTLSPVEIDCSTWVPEVPPEPAAYTVVKRTLAPTEVDCAGWAAEPGGPLLTVSVRFEDGELTDTFVQALRQSAPELGLEVSWPERDPSGAVSTVVLALRSHVGVAALYDAFQGLKATGCIIGSEQGAFRVRRKAS